MRGTWQTTDAGPGGGLVVAVVLALLAVGSGAVAAIASAFVITVAVFGGVALLGGLVAAGFLAVRLRQDRPVLLSRAVPEPVRHELGAGGPLAVESPQHLHVHFHGMDTEQAAEILRRQLRN